MFPGAHYQNMHVVMSSTMVVLVKPAMKLQAYARVTTITAMDRVPARQFRNHATAFFGGVPNVMSNTVARRRPMGRVHAAVVYDKEASKA